MAKEQRLVFGEVAALYDRARPTYPRALIDCLLALLRGRPAPQVLDVGCGTGKATVLLAARGMVGVGLEPDPDMAATAARNLAPFPGWSITVSDFEDFPASPGGDFDLLTCAQAWHWIDPSRRFQQASRLLHPGGWLALFWNRTGDDTSAIRREIDGVYAELFPGLSPHGTLTAGHPPVGAPPTDVAFEPSQVHTFSWVRRYRTAEFTELTQTHSDHRLLEPHQRQVLLARLAEVIDAHGGVYDHPYECWLWVAQRPAATA